MSFRSFADLLLSVALLHLPLALSRQVYTTSHGGTCIGPCAQETKEYYWCKQKGGNNKWWDYCSTEEGYDSYNRLCLSGCQRIRGSKYEQCYTENGWSKCGHVVEEIEHYYTSYNKLCDSDCILDGSYFECTDKLGNEGYCSPLNDVTIKGVLCREDHSCDSRDYDYTWCYTDNNNNWDYCGTVFSNCEYNNQKKYADGDEVCRITDTGNRRELVLIANVPSQGLHQPSRYQFTEACRLINTIDANFCFPNRIQSMASSDNIRLDMQGTFERDGVRYLNVQLQLNEPKQGSTTTTIAQIGFPHDLDTAVFARYIRRALQTSMSSAFHKAPIEIIITMNRI
ncbi:uncharacterized protein LOC100485991 [Xenopus tropicalis]|nr:uncharacterized protein LOC100485991 [Xenopus tropicalis]|eukprot:XP_002937439.1 PREDICTED: uncharacterized protein LOC100485991 [Xenopus tropicalis]